MTDPSHLAISGNGAKRNNSAINKIVQKKS
jgi:hypothetical protein